MTSFDYRQKRRQADKRAWRKKQDRKVRLSVANKARLAEARRVVEEGTRMPLSIKILVGAVILLSCCLLGIILHAVYCVLRHFISN